MYGRISKADHLKAQELLKKTGTVVKFKKVDLGTATSASDKNNVLRHFEEMERAAQEDNKINLSNKGRAEALRKFKRNDEIVARHGASQGPQEICP